jgi:chemotaxis protein MotB
MNNWQLSAARALAVVDRLEKMGVDGKRLVAAGHSEYRPIDRGNTPEAYAANRRVEFKLDEYSRQLSPQEPCPPLPEEEEEEG